MNDDGFRVLRWMDNNIVTMVTTVHTGNEKVERGRRKPRLNQKNKDHLEEVWGEQHTRNIAIPKVIDDYNHWMLGCDRADQLISYYRSEFRCRRTWMPLFLHCLDVIRTNSFVMANYYNNDDEGELTQKEYLCELIHALLTRADKTERGVLGKQTKTRSAAAHTIATVTPISDKKRRRISQKSPELPPERLLGKKESHLCGFVGDGKQRTCFYCSYQAAKWKALETTPYRGKISRVTRICLRCNVHLCKDHFNVYHMQVK
jgi:hypothetical protein